MAEIQYSVPEIHCEACVSSIRRALDTLPGVDSLAADLGQRRVTVAYQEAQVTPDQIRQKIERAGFDVE